jgi:hypothetical protein
MWIARLTLRRPYTFVVMSLLIAVIGGLSIVTTPVDIIPKIDIPVISVEDALTDLHALIDIVGRYHDAVGASRNYLRLAHTQYRTGSADYLIVIDAERTLQANQFSLAQVERWHSFLDRGEL